MVLLLENMMMFLQNSLKRGAQPEEEDKHSVSFPHRGIFDVISTNECHSI